MNAVVTEITTVTVTHTKQARFRCVARVDMPQFGIVAGQAFFLVKVRGDQYEIKAIFVEECEIAASGDATYTHRNMAGEQHVTTLRIDGNHRCDCAAKRGTCYHITLLRRLELAEAKALHDRRIEMHKALASRPMSTVEAGLSPFVLGAMAGRHAGQFSGKAA